MIERLNEQQRKKKKRRGQRRKRKDTHKHTDETSSSNSSTRRKKEEKNALSSYTATRKRFVACGITAFSELSQIHSHQFIYSHFNSYHCCIVSVHSRFSPVCWYFLLFFGIQFFFLPSFCSSPALDVCISLLLFLLYLAANMHAFFPLSSNLFTLYDYRCWFSVCFFFFGLLHPKQKRKLNHSPPRFDCLKRSVFCRRPLALSLSPLSQSLPLAFRTTFNYKCISGKTECNC